MLSASYPAGPVPAKWADQGGAFTGHSVTDLLSAVLLAQPPRGETRVDHHPERAKIAASTIA